MLQAMDATWYVSALVLLFMYAVLAVSKCDLPYSKASFAPGGGL